MTVGMIDAVVKAISDRDQLHLLQFIRRTLEADAESRRVEEPLDVERLFAAVDLLIGRNEQPWSPFVGTWGRGLESFSSRSSGGAFPPSEFEAAGRVVESAVRGQSVSVTSLARSMGRLIAQGVAKAIESANPPDVTEALEGLRATMLASLFDILSIDDQTRVEYLSPLIELSRRQGSLTIATLNYDRSVENAADLKSEPCDTGIETWLKSGELDWPTTGLRLLKLHGSIDWVFEREQTSRQLPLQRIRKVVGAEEKSRYDAPAVVFGEAGKLRAEGPFIELLLAWSALLRRADNLLIVGYSFRDQHINEGIARWFDAVPTRRIVLLSPTSPAEHSWGWDSFASWLGRVDEVLPGESEPAVKRFQYVAGKTNQALPAAITGASVALEAQ